MYISYKDRVSFILQLCKKHISYRGHFIRVLPKVAIVRTLAKEIQRTSKSLRYSSKTNKLILDAAHKHPAGYDTNKIFISTLNTLCDAHLVHNVIHEFTHHLQERFGKKDKAKYTWHDSPDEQEAELFAYNNLELILEFYMRAIKTRTIPVKNALSSRYNVIAEVTP